MNKPTLSIVIPVYNEQDHIVACLQSIMAQDELPDEVIVVDNNSSDLTAQLAKTFPLVRLISEPKQGIAHARNAGFEAAKGEVIGRIDADTRLPTYWVRQAKCFAREYPDRALSGGSYFYDLSLPNFAGWVQAQLAFRANRFILGHYITWGSNLVLPKKLWDSVKAELIEDPEIHEDIDLAIKLHRHGFKISYRPDYKVGVESRLFSEKRRSRQQHMNYLVMWPKTLEQNGLRRAWLGWVGVYLVYVSYLPFLGLHRLSQLGSYLKGKVRLGLRQGL